jgi:hypothetical protein
MNNGKTEKSRKQMRKKDEGSFQTVSQIVIEWEDVTMIFWCFHS